MKTPRSAWRDYRAQRADTTALSKGEAQRKKEKKKLKALPGAFRKKWKEVTNTLADQLRELASSGVLGSVLQGAKGLPGLIAANVPTIAAAGAGLLATATAAVVGADVFLDAGPLANDPVVEVEAERALAETEVLGDAVATVEARLDDVPSMEEFDALREEFEEELAVVAAEVDRIDGVAEGLDVRVADAEVALVEARAEVAAIPVGQIEDNAQAVEAVSDAVAEAEVQRLELAAVLDTVTATATEALGVAVQARDQVAITDAQLTEATQAAALAQQQLRQSSTEVLDAQQRLTQLQADQTASAQQIALAQAEVAQAQSDATAAQQAAADADARAAMAEADAAAAQTQLNDTVTVLTDLGQTVAGVDAALATTTQTATEAQSAAAALEAQAVTAEAERVANAAAATQAQAQAVQATTDAAVAQATGEAAQTDATAALDSLPVSAGPGAPLTIPPGPWQIGNTPATVNEDGTYLITLVAEYQSGSGNRVIQGVAVDGVRLDLAVEHQDYALFIPLTYTATFRLELTAGQTVNQALSHNSNGDTPWTSVLVLAERIG